MKLNPYKIGMNFYIILIVSIVTFIGCKTFEKHDEKNKMKRMVEQVLNTPDLTTHRK